MFPFTEFGASYRGIGAYRNPTAHEMSKTLLSEMSERSREVFRLVVESYLETGGPVGSKLVTGQMSERMSSATVRSVMKDLEGLGLLDSPHTSAGRMPTEMGLRLFVDGVMEIDPVAPSDRAALEQTLGNDNNTGAILDRMTRALSAMTQGASLVLTPTRDAPVRHIEFVSLGPDRALVVLVFADGRVENRIFTPPLGQTPSSLREAANFLNAMADGLTLPVLRQRIGHEIRNHRQELDVLATQMIEQGLALWDGPSDDARLIVRGQAHLLGDVNGDLDRIRELFDDLERKRDIAKFLELTDDGEGVRIFIGSENKLFSLSGSSLVVSPYMNADRKIVGAVGVIGPTRLNYGRIVPLVDLTAQLVGRMLSGGKG